MKRAYTHGELYRTTDDDELWMLGVEPAPRTITGLEDTDPAIETLPPRRMPRATEGR
jgi:hypothetical protein